jgi:DNA-binding CsgD family transcriptional regulator
VTSTTDIDQLIADARQTENEWKRSDAYTALNEYLRRTVEAVVRKRERTLFVPSIADEITDALCDTILAYDPARGDIRGLFFRILDYRLISANKHHFSHANKVLSTAYSLFAEVPRSAQRGVPKRLFEFIPDKSRPNHELIDELDEYNHELPFILDLLSKREWHVLRLFAAGQTYDQIAKRIGIKPKAVDNSLMRARSKFAHRSKNPRYKVA